MCDAIADGRHFLSAVVTDRRHSNIKLPNPKLSDKT